MQLSSVQLYIYIYVYMLFVVQFPVIFKLTAGISPIYLCCMLVDIFTLKSFISTPTGRKIGPNYL